MACEPLSPKRPRELTGDGIPRRIGTKKTCDRNRDEEQWTQMKILTGIPKPPPSLATL
jgi:hypothetical protein